jgi:putative ABC transport system permease protein
MLPGSEDRNVTVLERLWCDLVFGLRTQAKTPAATLAVVGTLSIGIATTSVSFALLNALFLRALPIREPDRFVRVYHLRDGSSQYFPISYPELDDIRELRDVLDGAVAEQPSPLSLGVAGSYERVWGELVSDGYFGLLGVQPAAGRFFGSHEEDVGEAVVVLGHGLWKRRFGADPNVVNTDLRVDGRTFHVIGVAPEDFHGTIVAFASDLWIPVRSAPLRQSDTADRSDRGYFTIAKLAPNVGVGQARAAVDALALRLQREHPETNRAIRFAALPEADGRVPPPFHDSVLGFSLLSIAVALLVTAIACANVAGILLARAAARRTEIGVRLALGASRGRIVGQLLTEAATLSIAAGALGLALAWLATRLVGNMRLPIARGASLSLDVSLDGRVLAVVLVVTMLTGILFGLAPALEASRPDLLAVLKDARRADGRRRSWSRGLLLTTQVAVSMLLLAGTGLFIRSLQHGHEIDLGFDPRNVVTTAVDIRQQHYSPATGNRFWATLLDDVRRLPQTESASLTARLPLELGIVMLSLAPEGFQPAVGQAWPSSEFAVVEPDYFRTLRIRFVEGRDFTERDNVSAPNVIIVNDVVARQFWSDGRAVGRSIVNPEGRRYEVVGVVRRSKYLSVGEDPKPYVYFPLRQGASRAMTIVARGSGDPGAFLHAIESAVHRRDGTAPLYDVSTMSERVALSLAPTTGGVAALGFVGLMAVGLTSLGLFGVVAQAVNRRTYEIGVRRALGAQDAHVIWLVVRDAIGLVVLGVGVGLVATLVLSPLLRALLYNVDPSDPLVFGLAPAVLVVVCTLAAWLPTYRATRINAAAALRYE